jgi:hypothetical protein
MGRLPNPTDIQIHDLGQVLVPSFAPESFPVRRILS